jgi:hypothetical protein
VAQECLGHLEVLAEDLMLTGKLQQRRDDGLDQDQRAHQILPPEREP